MNEVRLERALQAIWKAGDHDEMSIKHIGHGVAALIAFGDWKQGADYELPNWFEDDAETKELRNVIAPLWDEVTTIHDELGRDRFLETLSGTNFGFYPITYLESEYLPYAKEMN